MMQLELVLALRALRRGSPRHCPCVARRISAAVSTCKHAPGVFAFDTTLYGHSCGSTGQFTLHHPDWLRSFAPTSRRNLAFSASSAAISASGPRRVRRINCFTLHSDT
jgi:hypothetical protein